MNVPVRTNGWAMASAIKNDTKIAFSTRTGNAWSAPALVGTAVFTATQRANGYVWLEVAGLLAVVLLSMATPALDGVGEANAPLKELFGYSSAMRSATSDSTLASKLTPPLPRPPCLRITSMAKVVL